MWQWQEENKLKNNKPWPRQFVKARDIDWYPIKCDNYQFLFALGSISCADTFSKAGSKCISDSTVSRADIKLLMSIWKQWEYRIFYIY